MVLDIKGLTGGSVQGTGGTGRTNKRSSSTGASSDQSSSSGTDTVSITSSATQLQALEEKVASMPVVDAQLVEETRNALATGTHEVDPDSTAEGVLTVERQFAQQE